MRRDGRNSISELARLVNRSPAHLQLILLQGLVLAGFNVVDLHALHVQTGRPVLVVARRAPDLDRIRAALLSRVPGARRKWALIEAAGPMEACGGVFVQRAGLSLAQVQAALGNFTVTGRVPAPLRAAQLIARGVRQEHSQGGRV